MIIKKFIVIILTIMTLLAYDASIISASSISAYDCMGVKYSPNRLSTAICDGLIAVQKNSRWGFADINGRLVIPCQYSDVNAFNNGYAMVCLNKKWGVINTTGKLIIKAQFDNAKKLDIIDGYLQIVTVNGQEMLIDKNGHEINITKKYPGYGIYKRLSNDFIAVAKGNGWGVIDKTGKEIIPPQYPYPPILINKSGIFGFIQKTNIQVDKNAQFNSDDIYPIDENYSGGIVNKDGEILLPFEYAIKRNRLGFRWFDIHFLNGISPVQSLKDGKISYVDENGKIILTIDRSKLVGNSSNGPLYYFHNFSDGMCRIESKGKWGFIDEKGQIIVAPNYDFVFDYYKGHSIVRANNQKVGIIDKKGNIIIPLIYDSVSYFNDGMIKVCNKGKYGVLNSFGKTVLPLIYNAPPDYDPTSGLFKVNKGGKYGFVNKSNKIIIQCKYDAVTHFANKMARVKLGSQYGYINNSGKVVIPIKYRSLSNIIGNRIYAMDDSNASYVLDIKGNVIFKAKTSKFID